MLFAIQCEDKPDSLDLRMATRPKHLEYLDGHAATIIQGGPVLDAGGKPCGSLLLVDVADQAAAEALAANDPYALAGLFGAVSIRPFRQVFSGGARIAG
ncbi:YciI family protein [Teichococcus vastitatis]|jgi:uncharacterized protein YciI|uniref:YciI family protein n=1 Tax=Teichococcus vastitatis TaxID=2307076 RepID=A0ABS9WC52_9PROT|nr:YciI family protein [Pseudoroseomonas vastitatis]MCI0756875.1 YciI family protein [Pseudoroseomonas vastitatis]